MYINIYQIDEVKDENRLSFESYEKAIKTAGKIDPKIYKKVFSGKVECNNLESVFTLFNLNPPLDHQGHSLSVSDIVEVTEKSSSDNPSVGFYYCDNIGFKRIDDDFTAIKGIKMLVVEPHEPPYEALIADDYKAWQRVVGGNFEMVGIDKDIYIICNDIGKLIGLEGNRKVNDDIITGTFMITADGGGGEVKDLTDEQIEHYTKLFEKDETYTQEEINDSIEYKFISM